jgi:hypothetical protein
MAGRQSQERAWEARKSKALWAKRSERKILEALKDRRKKLEEPCPRKMLQLAAASWKQQTAVEN